MIVYWVLLWVIACERGAELVVSARHATAARRGGVEYGFGHFPVMIVLHVALIAGCVLEPLLGDRTFVPALGWPMLRRDGGGERAALVVHRAPWGRAGRRGSSSCPGRRWCARGRTGGSLTRTTWR